MIGETSQLVSLRIEYAYFRQLSLRWVKRVQVSIRLSRILMYWLG